MTAGRRSTSCSTPAPSTRTATGTSSSTTPRPSPTTCVCGCASVMPDPIRRRCTCFRRCGSATAGRGSPTSRGRTIREEGGVLVAEDALLGTHDPDAQRCARAAVLRQRDQHSAALGPAGAGLSEGRHQRPRRPRRGDGQSTAHGNEGGAVVPARGAGRSDGRGATAAGARRRASSAKSWSAAMAARAARGRRLLRRARAGGDRGRGAGHAPGVRRHALEQAVLQLRRRALAEGRPGQPAAARRALSGRNGELARTSTTATSSRCRTSGSTRGTRPGTSPSTA